MTEKATINKQKQASQKELHNLCQHKDCANTPIKLIRLMGGTLK